MARGEKKFITKKDLKDLILTLATFLELGYDVYACASKKEQKLINEFEGIVLSEFKDEFDRTKDPSLAFQVLLDKLTLSDWKVVRAFVKFCEKRGLIKLVPKSKVAKFAKLCLNA